MATLTFLLRMSFLMGDKVGTVAETLLTSGTFVRSLPQYEFSDE